jgi:hypothetical protein
VSKNENKTHATAADVTAFLDAVADPVQRADAHALVALMSEVSGHGPRMWGPSMVDFGRYHDRGVLREVVARSWAVMAERYPE